MSQPTLEKLKAAVPDFPAWKNEYPDQPSHSPDLEYVAVDVMPTFAGAGGGGTGEGDVERALVPGYLVHQVFQGKASDFVMIRVRGTSMMPLFQHDDDVLIDKRDPDPTQGGPFAIWDADGEQYVIKNVERLPGGIVRVFSENPKFTPFEIRHEGTRILGRPVWFARRL